MSAKPRSHAASRFAYTDKTSLTYSSFGGKSAAVRISSQCAMKNFKENFHGYFVISTKEAIPLPKTSGNYHKIKE